MALNEIKSAARVAATEQPSRLTPARTPRQSSAKRRALTVRDVLAAAEAVQPNGTAICLINDIHTNQLPEVAELLVRLVYNNAYSARAVVAVFTSLGIEVGPSAIQRHRARRCKACEKGAR